ncbi:hypothetical protein ABVT39_025095 [Epinephelus coioides]
MAGGKVFRPCGGNEPPLTDKGAVTRQALLTEVTVAQSLHLQNKSTNSAAVEMEVINYTLGVTNLKTHCLKIKGE